MFRFTRKASPPDFIELDGLRLPPGAIRFCTVDFQDTSYFLHSAKEEVARLREIAGLTEKSRILDIGFGQGRLAIGLQATLPNIPYMGVDVDRRSVEWCQRNIAALRPNFRFIHTDFANERYNLRGTPFVLPLQLPFVNAAFDVIFLYSVFTHMLTPDLQRYLSEIVRLLAPAGQAFFTCYVEDNCEDEVSNPPGYLEDLETFKGALHRVRFRRQYLEDMIARAGLQVVQLNYRSESITKQSSVLVALS